MKRERVKKEDSHKQWEPNLNHDHGADVGGLLVGDPLGDLPQGADLGLHPKRVNRALDPVVHPAWHDQTVLAEIRSTGRVVHYGFRKRLGELTSQLRYEEEHGKLLHRDQVNECWMDGLESLEQRRGSEVVKITY